MIRVLTNMLDMIIRQTGRITRPVSVVSKMARRIHPVQSPILRSDPEHAPAVLQHGQYQVARKAPRIIRMMSEMRELIGAPVKPVQPAAPRADPQIATAIFNHVVDQVIRKAPVIADLILVNGKRIPIVFVQTLPRPKPHKAPAVLQGTKNIALQQPLRGTQMLKGKMPGLWVGKAGGQK